LNITYGEVGKWGSLFPLYLSKLSSWVPLLHCGLVGISLAPTGIPTVAGANPVGNSSIWLKKLVLEPTRGWTPTVLFFFYLLFDLLTWIIQGLWCHPYPVLVFLKVYVNLGRLIHRTGIKWGDRGI